MYNVSQVFKDAIKGNGREFKATIAIRDSIFDDNNIIEIELNEDVNPADSFMIGSVSSNKIEATLINLPNNLILDGAKIAPKVGLNTGIAYEDVPLGIFWIDEIQKVNNTVKITAFDSMIKLEKAYFSDLNYPASIYTVAQEICNKAGVELATVLPNTQINKIEGYTYREAISFIASFLGCFARFNRDGKLEITSYVDTDTIITADYYVKNPINSEKTFSIGKLSCKVGDSILSSGSSGNEVQFENPIMTQSQLDSIYNTLKKISYMPFDMEWKGNHALQAGDKINIADPNGNTYNTLLMQNQISYKGSIAGKASAKANTGQKQEFNSNGSIKNTVDRMVVEQANIKLLLADTATIENLNATNAKIDNLTANVATISQLNATNARVGTLEANSATIAQLNAVKASISDLTANKANITDLSASNGRITTLESKAASIDTLLAGNISVSNLQAGLITADSGLIANGAIKDAMIADLSASKITAGTINGANINVINLNADNITVGRLNGQLLKDGSVSGLAVSSGAIDNSKVASNAAIEGSKLNISSVVTAINSGSTLLTSNKINIDADNGTLDVAFKNLKSTVTSTANVVSSQGTSISAIQGQISSKVWQQDITTAVNNIQVGGRNLIRNTGFNGNTFWEIFNGVDSIDTTVKYNGYNSLRKIRSGLTADSWAETRSSAVTCNVGDTFTASAYVYTDDITSFSTISNAITMFIRGFDSSGNIVSPDPYNLKVVPTENNKWYRFSLTGTITDPKMVTIKLHFSLRQNGKIWIACPKLEVGTKVTDFTVAPEDIDSQITTINTNYSTLNQTVNGISLNVSSLQSTTSNLGTRMTTAESSITALNNSIILKVNATDFNTYKTNNDTAVNSKASQTSLDSTNRDISSLTTRVSTAESSISLLQNQIILKVTQTDINNSINAMNIGIRNYALGTSTQAVSPTFTAVNNQTFNIYTVSKLVSGKKVTISFNYNISNLTLVSNQTNRIYVQFIGNNGTTFWQAVSPNLNLQNGIFKFLATVTLSTTNIDYTVNVRVDYISGGTLIISNFKVELGDKASDWCPAIEDTQGQIDSAVTRISTAESNISQLSGSISLKVDTTTYNTYTSTNDSNIYSLQSRISAAELKITDSSIVATVRNSSLYAGDLSSLVNATMQGNNLIPDPSFENGGIGWNSGGNIITSDFHLGAKCLKFSSTGYKAITGAITVVPGRKYQISFWYKTSSDANGTPDSEKIRIGKAPTSTLVAGFGTTGVSTSWKQVVNTWTFSSDINSVYIQIGTNLTTGWIEFDDIALIDITDLDALTSRVGTAESNISQLSDSISLKVDSSTYNSYKTTNDNNISNLQSRMSNAELKITDSAIVSTVRSSTSYTSDLSAKANQTALNTTNSNLSSLTGRVSTVESSITQLNNSIVLKVNTSDFNTLTGRVSTTESNISVLQGQISSKVNAGDFGSLITQNASNVKVAVGQIGGNNLIKNGGFEFDQANWYQNDTVWCIFAPNQTDWIWRGKTPFIRVNSRNGGLYQTFSTIPGKTYTMQFVAFNATQYEARIGILNVKQFSLKSMAAGFIKYTYTFNATTAQQTFVIIGDEGATIYIDDIKIEEGENATAWSANSNELKNSSFEVTEDHARFTSSSGNYTEFAPSTTGLVWHMSDGVTTYDYHYLSYFNEATVGVNMPYTVTLPGVFKGKKFKVLTAIKSVSSGMDFMMFINCYVNNVDTNNGTFMINGCVLANSHLLVSRYDTFYDSTSVAHQLLNTSTYLTTKYNSGAEAASTMTVSYLVIA